MTHNVLHRACGITIDLSASALGHGRVPVRTDRVLLFAAAFRFTPEILCQAADTAGVGIGLIHHRKRASLGAPALRRIHATLALTHLQVEAVTQAAALRRPPPVQVH
ncbi:hypothetical protein ABZ402_44430 [Streptomyces mirabilis]|uniref:hypothetical protein n=1 Tax=Streptomyces mirabilis TaxID=68239 RepID=UPI0033EB413E